MNRPKELLLKK